MVIGGAIVATVLAFGALPFPVPSVAAFMRAAWPVALLVPLALAIVLPWALATWDPRVESMATRPIALLDAAFVLTVTTMVAWACVQVATWGTRSSGIDAARNALGFVGLALIGRWAGGRDVGSVLPVGYVVAAAFFGGATREDAAWWAWLARPAGDRSSWEQAAVLLAIGIVLTIAGPRQRNATAL